MPLAIKDVLDALVKKGIVVVYGRTRHGLAVHLNIARKKDIEQIVFEREEA